MFGFSKTKPKSAAQSRVDFDDSVRSAIVTAREGGVPRQALANMLAHFSADIERGLEAERQRRNYTTTPDTYNPNLPQ